MFTLTYTVWSLYGFTCCSPKALHPAPCSMCRRSISRSMRVVWRWTWRWWLQRTFCRAEMRSSGTTPTLNSKNWRACGRRPAPILSTVTGAAPPTAPSLTSLHKDIFYILFALWEALATFFGCVPSGIVPHTQKDCAHTVLLFSNIDM